ncbi:MAG: putative quinol monooxygenase [Chloroflexota bacterium]
MPVPGIAPTVRWHHVCEGDSHVSLWRAEMIGSILEARAKSTDDALEICRLFYQSLQLHQEPGWLRGSCMTGLDDPRQVLIHEYWSSRAAWDAWQNSTADRFLRERSTPLLDTPWEAHLYEGAYVAAPK